MTSIPTADFQVGQDEETGGRRGECDDARTGICQWPLRGLPLRRHGRAVGPRDLVMVVAVTAPGQIRVPPCVSAIDLIGEEGAGGDPEDQNVATSRLLRVRRTAEMAAEKSWPPTVISAASRPGMPGRPSTTPSPMAIASAARSASGNDGRRGDEAAADSPVTI